MRKYNLINPDLPVIEEELWAVFDNETGQFVRPLKKEVFESKGAAATAVGLALRYLDIDPKKEQPLSFYSGSSALSEAKDQQNRLKAERKKLRDSGRYAVTQVVLSQVSNDASLDDPTNNLNEILALLNGDGGHRVSEVGYHQATEEAIETVADMMNRLAQSPEEIVIGLDQLSAKYNIGRNWAITVCSDGSGYYTMMKRKGVVGDTETKYTFANREEMIQFEVELIQIIIQLGEMQSERKNV